MRVIEGTGQAINCGHLPAMRSRADHTWGQVCFQLRRSEFYDIHQRSIEASFTSAHKPGSDSLAPMKAAVMAGGPRGAGRCDIYGGGLGFTAHIHGLFTVQIQGMFMQPLELRAMGLPGTVLVLNFALSSIHLGPAIMVWPRQRMLSRRGTSRGGSSLPPVDETSPRCCHCHCIQEANPLRSSQFLDSEAPDFASSPAFGSAIFNFNSSLNCPRISAHVSVLFIEESPDGSDSRGSRGMQPADGSTKATKTPSADPENVSKSPLAGPSGAQEVMINQKEDVNMETVPNAAEVAEFGWCRVVEEDPEE